MTWEGNIVDRFPDWGSDVASAKWPAVQASLSVGQQVRGDVIVRAPFGVWVDISVGWPALLRVPEMYGARERPIRFEDYPAIGTIIEAWVLWLSDRREIILCQYPPELDGFMDLTTLRSDQHNE